MWAHSPPTRRTRCTDMLDDSPSGLALLRNRRSGEATQSRAFGVISPAVIPWPGNRAAQALNGMLLARQIRPHIAAMTGRPVFWTSLPTAYPAVDKIKHGPVVYYCGDGGTFPARTQEPAWDLWKCHDILRRGSENTTLGTGVTLEGGQAGGQAGNSRST